MIKINAIWMLAIFLGLMAAPAAVIHEAAKAGNLEQVKKILKVPVKICRSGVIQYLTVCFA
ncbi:MAG: hypothetical protein MUP22_05745 [Desulfobacterales bacterium]|nr:hypothetical protein [Desulfobacterales bacterium]